MRLGLDWTYGRIFYSEDGETLEQADKVVDAPSLEVFRVKCQPSGQGFEQPDLVKDVPAHGKGVGLDDL